MKNILLILFIVFTLNNIYGQEVNRYTELTPSTYKPAASSNYVMGSSHSEAIRRFENIHNSIDYYETRIESHFKNVSDPDFLYEMKLIQSGIQALLNTEMSLNRAESYIKAIGKKYNKAIKDYNKRVKKFNKELKKKRKKAEKESIKNQKKLNE